jgi:hypothetical protein
MMVLCIEILLVYLLKLIKFDTCHHDHCFLSIMEFMALNCNTFCYVNWALSYIYSYVFRYALITSLCDSQT